MMDVGCAPTVLFLRAAKSQLAQILFSPAHRYYFLTRRSRGQDRAARLQDYAVSNRVAEMGGHFSSLAHTHPNQVRVASLSMSQNPLCSIPEINYELSRASRIDVEEKMSFISWRRGSARDLASGFVAVSTGKIWSNVRDALYSDASETRYGSTDRDSSERSVGNRMCLTEFPPLNASKHWVQL